VRDRPGDIADAAEEVVAPAMPAACPLDRNALVKRHR
jgi:hypothetical protein